MLKILNTLYTGVEINFFYNLPVGQLISNVCLPEKISTCPKKIDTVSFEIANYQKKSQNALLGKITLNLRNTRIRIKFLFLILCDVT